MSKLKLNLESLGVETFTTAPELEKAEAAFLWKPTQTSCIEQCTTSCVP